MKSEKIDKCARNNAKGMAMELSDLINDAHLLVEHILLFKKRGGQCNMSL